MKKFLLVLSIFITSNLIAQPAWQWAASGGGSNTDGSTTVSEDEKIMDMKVDDFGNIYVTGRIRNGANIQGTTVTTYGEYDIFLAKFDCMGNLICAKTAGGSNADEGNAIALSDDGHIYLVGKARSSPINTFYMGDTTITEQCSDFFLAKYDTTGDFRWIRIASPGVPNIVSLAFAVTVSDSNFVHAIMRAGVSGDFSPGFPVVGGKDYLIKMDHLGNTISADSMYAGFHPRDYVLFDKNQNYYFTGTFPSSATLNIAGTSYTTQGLADLIIIKYNNDATLAWVYTQGMPGTMVGVRGIDVDSQENIFITGTINDNFVFGNDTLQNPLPAAAFPFIAKLNSSGQAQWGYSASTQYASNGRGITTDYNGNVYTAIELTGDGIFGSQNLTSIGQSNMVLAKHDSNGSILWADMLISSGGKEDMFTVLKPDNAGNIYLGGSFKGIVEVNGDTIYSAGGKTDFLLMKHGMASCLVGIDESSALNLNYGIQAFPNPSTGKFIVRLERYIPNRNNIVSVYNNIGQFIKEEKIIFPGVAEIDITGEPVGIYHVRAFDGEKYVNGKIIKE